MSWPGSDIAGAKRFAYLSGITTTENCSEVAAPLLHAQPRWPKVSSRASIEGPLQRAASAGARSALRKPLFMAQTAEISSKNISQVHSENGRCLSKIRTSIY